MKNGEWRSQRERGNPTETTCDRRQLPKNKNSTTHSARKAHHPALRLPAAVSVDIPLVDGEWGGESHAKSHPSSDQVQVSPPSAHQPANLLSAFTLGRKTQLPFIFCSAHEKPVLSAPQTTASSTKRAMTCQCLHLDAWSWQPSDTASPSLTCRKGPHRNRCLTDCASHGLFNL